MLSIILGYAAGVLSILSPCVLPLAPVILAGAMREGRLGPLAVMGGLVISFTAMGMVLPVAGQLIGIGQGTIRAGAAAILFLAGAFMLAGAMHLRFMKMAEPLLAGVKNYAGAFNASGIGGQVALGVLLGALWAPCAGPTLGAAIGLAMSHESLINASAVMAFFALGAVTPLVFLSYAGRYAIGLRNKLASAGGTLKPALGITLLATGVAVLSGADKHIESILTNASPAWLTDITTRY
ncbi:MAG: cytochrome c biogenesis protein CcdA [Nitrospinae bacterium]|nr:cytochrome c biogenesis protein CcdA [Nitrospinota bacterium]